MATNEIRNALKNLDDVALAYTVKTSEATTPEEFLDDYIKNIALFKEIKANHPDKWLV